MLVGALLFLGGFALFTTTTVALGAIMPTVRDAGQVFAPLMILVFVPFYAISLVVSDPRALIVQVLTFFPYTAAVTSMLRNGFGSLSPLDATIVIVELFALSAAILRVAVRLFRYGSIEYSRKVSIRTALGMRS
jgi:ABC-2 type transport system permease protein